MAGKKLEFVERCMNVLNDHKGQSQPTLLLVDDSIDVHRLIKARFRNSEMTLISAHGGREGIKMAKEHLPTLILLDLDMPEVDGLEVLRTLREDLTTRNIPVIVLSGLVSTQDKVTAFDLDAYDYVTKPFDLVELRARIRAALKTQRLLTMLTERARLDGLTGLWNRAYFDERLAEEISGAVRHGRALSVVMLDLDHFKSVNDSFGHPAGDAVLERFASIIKAQCRKTDIACRYGGEEFSLIMPDTGPEDAKAVLDRVRTALEQIRWPMHPERNVTVSIGVAGCTQCRGDVSAKDWVHVADKNLYKAKESGRNRVVISEVDSDGEPKLAAAG